MLLFAELLNDDWETTIADLRHIRSALLNFKSIKIGALLILK